MENSRVYGPYLVPLFAVLFIVVQGIAGGEAEGSALTLALVLGVMVGAGRRAARARARLPLALAHFFRRSGYRPAELPDGLLLDQVALAGLALGLCHRARALHLVRQVAGRTVHWRYRAAEGQGGLLTCSSSFSLALERSPRVLLQLVERSVAGGRRTTGEIVLGLARTWQQRYLHEVPLDHPALAARFRAFADKVESARDLLARWELAEALLALPEVDLVVAPNQIRLADPAQRNCPEQGGYLGWLEPGGGDPLAAAERTLPAHDQAAALLLLLERTVG